MQLFLTLIALTMMSTTYTLFDFTTESNDKDWRVVNDGVMGGVSQSKFTKNDKGHGEFSGNVSLDNNGGFASVRYNFEQKKIKADARISIRLKGDGKKYQFRLKDKASRYYSYIYSFETSGEWETIVIDVKDMYPSFRGRKLDQANFDHKAIEELTFLIANKRNENFKLQIDKIEVI